MTAFFACIIIIGSIIVAVSMVWMIIEKKNGSDYRLELDERKYELRQLIDEAEQLMNELNNFSGYIVTQLEKKQRDVEETIKSADERLDHFPQIIDTSDSGDPGKEKIQNEKVLNQNETVKRNKPAESTSARKGKVIPFDIKKHEAIKLCKEGMENSEIARLLNMGKGEIELISRISQD